MDRATQKRMQEAVSRAISDLDEVVDLLNEETIPVLIEMSCTNDALKIAQKGMLRLGYTKGVLEQMNTLLKQELGD